MSNSDFWNGLSVEMVLHTMYLFILSMIFINLFSKL